MWLAQIQTLHFNGQKQRMLATDFFVFVALRHRQVFKINRTIHFALAGMEEYSTPGMLVLLSYTSFKHTFNSLRLFFCHIILTLHQKP